MPRRREDSGTRVLVFPLFWISENHTHAWQWSSALDYSLTQNLLSVSLSLSLTLLLCLLLSQLFSILHFLLNPVKTRLPVVILGVISQPGYHSKSLLNFSPVWSHSPLNKQWFSRRKSSVNIGTFQLGSLTCIHPKVGRPLWHTDHLIYTMGYVVSYLTQRSTQFQQRSH